jgi:SAM-dependent methyltransferase
MRQGVLELREFYASPLGEAVRRMVSRKIVEAWGEAVGVDVDVLALGYATPFLDALRGKRVLAAMPAGQGAEVWPAAGANRAFLIEEAALPLANALIDRVVVAHALEESANPLCVLQEIHRVLAPSGRAILVATARHGLWADAESSPFGHGRPFSRHQLESLVREAELEPVGWTRALYVPPAPALSRWADAFEQVGAVIWPPFAGLILMEVVKTTFAVRPIGLRARAARPARALRPAPARSPLPAPWTTPRNGS